MDAFDYAYEQTVGYEGGYVNDPDDPGGETKYGITKAVFDEELRSGYISGVNAVKDITPAIAKAIYKRRYWLALGLNGIYNIVIAAEIFDTAVNMGITWAVKIVQESLNYLGEKLTVDGAMGPKTMAALRSWANKDERALYVCLNGFQFQRYVEICEKNQSLLKYSRGWTKRIQDYRSA